MFPSSHTVCLVREQQRLEWLADATRLRLAAGAAPVGSGPRRRTPAVPALVRAIASALGRIGALAHDSRESLRTKEQELAALGIAWTTDPAHERGLAAELRRASQRRAAMPLQAAHAAEPPPIMSPMADERAIRPPVAEDRYPV